MSDNKPGRRRRTPEQARAEILAAATELIARHGSDRVTLAGVAEAAGVTHGLVSHYFGTYDALAAEVLRGEKIRHQVQVRERMRSDGGVPYAAAVLDVLFDTVADERYLRLWAWSALHSRHDTIAAEDLTGLVDAIQAGIASALPQDRRPDRARIEGVVLLGLAATYGYALGGRTWQAALGHDSAGSAEDRTFRTTLATALAGYLEGDR